MEKKTLSPEEIEGFRKLNEEARSFCSKGKGRCLSIVISVVSLLLLWFFWVPAFNFHDIVLYKLFAIILGEYLLLRIATSGFYKPSRNLLQSAAFLFREEKPAFFAFWIVILIMAGGTLISSPLFYADQYCNILAVEEGNFTEDVAMLSDSDIPVIDTASAVQLGKRALGELSDLVSQFEIKDTYAEMNLTGTPTCIASLEYGNFFKWMSNRSSGLPGYVAVNMITQEAEVVRLESGMKYSESEPFFRNIDRYLRLHYPTYMFDSAHLEVDQEGNAWWVCPRLKKTISLFGGSDIIGAVLVNAVTGENAYYAAEDIPVWVDQLYSSDLIEEQYHWFGRYQNGFLNSVLSQTGVTDATDGCNYLAIGDDIYLYTGITSAGKDESNIGFLLCNMRTKETSYYAVSGATEVSAQGSAEGAVQHLGYTATFPLLLNIADKPTYFMALKDSANLVKKYAMVNVEQYQVAAVGDTIEECRSLYSALLVENGLANGSAVVDEVELITVAGDITDLRENTVNGTTRYYITIDTCQLHFLISADAIPEAVLLNPGDSVTISYAERGEIFTEVIEISFTY